MPVGKLLINLALVLILTILFKYSYMYLHEGGHYLAARLSGFQDVKIGFTKYLLPIYIEIDDDEIARTHNANVNFSTLKLWSLRFYVLVS